MTATGTARQALPSDRFTGRSLNPDRWRYLKHPRCHRDPRIRFEPNTSIQVGERPPASKDSSMHVFDHHEIPTCTNIIDPSRGAGAP
jgi:hypothetical protein